ncbi:DHA2 family efflux MFS transporter permease subunit [Saccharopolyspora sp. NPDC050642]|uniref:DHA2 family efflux MFS transporter permease subunit n=1 Tax=Saccharopolyspora sp. NPDC050642 TaxID=3157099 RepID=UPI0033DCFC70
MLASVFLATFMALLDMSIVNVALPAIQAGLGATATGAQWVVDGYTLCLSAFMLTGGALGDRFGRKKVFLVGLGIFTAGSAWCALAPTIELLIAGRLVQGAGASVLTPGALSLLTHAYPDPAARARMIGIWGGFSGLATVLGPLVGGLLTDRFGWPALFLINLPLAVVALVLGLRGIRESASPEHAATDPLGQVLAVFGLAGLAYAVIESAQASWGSAGVLLPLLVGLGSLAAFIVVEARSPNPMLPVGLFRQRQFAVTTAASFVIGFGSYGCFYLFSLFLQQVRGAGATAAGLQFVPYSLAIALGTVVSGRWVGRRGHRVPMFVGYTVTGAALLAMLVLRPDTPYLVIGVLFAVLGSGMGLAIAATNAAAMSAVAPHRSGIAAATVNALRQAGAALGIAVLGMLVTARGVAVLADDIGGPAAQRAMAGGGADGLFGAGFTAGLHLSLVVAGVATLLVAALIVALPRAKSPEPAPGDEAPAAKTPAMGD